MYNFLNIFIMFKYEGYFSSTIPRHIKERRCEK